MIPFNKKYISLTGIHPQFCLAYLDENLIGKPIFCDLISQTLNPVRVLSQTIKLNPLLEVRDTDQFSEFGGVIIAPRLGDTQLLGGLASPIPMTLLVVTTGQVFGDLRGNTLIELFDGQVSPARGLVNSNLGLGEFDQALGDFYEPVGEGDCHCHSLRYQ